MAKNKKQLQNSAVVLEVYHKLLPDDMARANGLRTLVRDHSPAAATSGSSTAAAMTEEVHRTAVEVADRVDRVVALTPGLAVDVSVGKFKSDGWDVTPENVESEFKAVERRVFSDGIHWGRIIAFLAFSVSFSAYVSSRGINGGAESIFAWTIKSLNNTLSEFIERENGWEGLIKYADTLLKAQQRLRPGNDDPQQQQQQQQAGLWDSVAAYGAGIGALGVASLLAIGMRQAFS